MIRHLDKHLVNKIAAGEVVERPVSIVKELVENAIDAGAGFITVEIKEGGLSFIRVTDNGCGIPDDQVLLAFEQHATSKIAAIDDLSNINTLGFRGEALASIASVSHIEMITKPGGTLSGTRIELQAGVLVTRQELGCMDGTTIHVSNLFFNTPARLKFLKKPPTEAAYITDLMQRMALGYPNVSFKYIQNGQIVFTTSANQKMTIYSIYGSQAANNLLELDEPFLSGYIGKPEVARPTRSAENFFINNRYVKSKILQNALEDAYREYLPPSKFPLCVLHLNISTKEVDVNVHPTKMEVRFANEQSIYNNVKESLSHALLSQELTTSGRSARSQNVQVTRNFPTIFPKKYRQESTVAQPKQPIEPPKRETESEKPLTVFKSIEEQSASQPSIHTEMGKKPDFTIISQIFNTYWIAVKGSELFLIDQHAAHERIVYEKILNELKSKNASSQKLIEPLSLKLSPQELQIAVEHRGILNEFGFDFDEDGGDISIKAIPMIFKGPMGLVFFSEILEKIEKGLDDSPTETIRKNIASLACKAAIKANDSISTLESKKLVEQLLLLENPYFCPHGRPTIIKFTLSDIEHLFKRF
ncbi:MAG: DNA mismatch repair endonuclease MutL [Turicibacter sp.]|nr:DNA mismatch repair endonuclease MutL [Turicibacter sp.]